MEPASPSHTMDLNPQEPSTKRKKHKKKHRHRHELPEEEVIEVPATAEQAEEIINPEEEEVQMEYTEEHRHKKKRRRSTEHESTANPEKKLKRPKKKHRSTDDVEGEKIVVNGSMELARDEVEYPELIPAPVIDNEEETEVVRETPTKRRKEKKHRHEEPVEPQPEPETVAEEADNEASTKKQKKEKKEKKKKPQEPEVIEPPIRRSKTKDDPSPRRPRPGPFASPPPVIIPFSADGSHTNSKGVAPPPRPAAYDKGPYTPAEDALIHSVIRRYCKLQAPPLNRAGFLKLLWNNDRHKTDFWNILLTNLPLRSRYSLYGHVRRLYNDFPDRGKWTDEQDDELRDLIAQKGTKWSAIGGILNRMPEDCRDRWKNYLVCGEKRKKNVWDDDETLKLVGILDEMFKTIIEQHEENGTLVLRINEDEDERERNKRLENEKAYHRDEIDWTVVSEKMGHTRSRMQCLWKGKNLWARQAKGLEGITPLKRGRKPGEGTETKKAKKGKKIVEEEQVEEEEHTPALVEAKKMLVGDYFFVMQRISIQGYDCLASIDWNKIAGLDNIKYFAPEHFKAGFHAFMKDNNPDKKDLRSFVAQQLEDMSELPALVRNRRYRPPGGTPSQKTPVVEKLVAEKVKEAVKPLHSPGNPFAKQRKEIERLGSPFKEQKKKEKPTPAKVRKSPMKQFKSAEYISDSDNNQGALIEEVYEEEPTEEWPVEMEYDNSYADDIEESEEPAESGLEADDEMGESVAFGQARKRR